MKKRWITILSLLLGLALVVALSKPLILKRLYPQKYKTFVEQSTRDNNLPEGLIYAVIHTESGFKPQSVSSVGARGLMQLTEETFEWVKYRMKDGETEYDDLFQPEMNIRYGGWLLRLLLDEFKTVDNALLAYHAGWGATQNWLANREYAPDGLKVSKVPYPSTAHYQYKVLKTWTQYQKLYKY